MAPEWFKTAIQGPAYGQHMRRPGIKLTLQTYYHDAISGCNGGVCYCNHRDFCNDGSSVKISGAFLTVTSVLLSIIHRWGWGRWPRWPFVCLDPLHGSADLKQSNTSKIDIGCTYVQCMQHYEMFLWFRILTPNKDMNVTVFSCVETGTNNVKVKVFLWSSGKGKGKGST